MSRIIIEHFVVAVAISFALSIGFWIVYNIFELTPFFVVSIACAIAGAAIGVVVRRGVVLTIIATTAIRIAVFFAVMNF